MSSVEPAPRAARGPCILLVDDDPSIQEVLTAILMLEGYQVTSARSGIEALDHLRAGVRPCLILLDLRMPGMDGREFLRVLTREESLASIPVVVISGDRDAPQLAASRTVNAVVLKPMELSDLLQVVARYC